MFTNELTYWLDKLHFILVVIARLFKIFFRRKKDIQELFFKYQTEHLFDTSYLIINYRFRNALFYRFGKHLTLEKQIKILNLKNFESEFDLIVYGFFRKKIYKLKFEPQWRLDNSSFKTSFSNLTLKLKQQPIPKLGQPAIYLTIDKPIIEISKIAIVHKTIKLKTSTYNQNEFI